MDKAQLDLALWEAIRAAGVFAFALLTASVLLGLGVKSRVADPFMKRGWVYEFHQTLSVAALLVLSTHIVLVVANRHVAFSVPAVLVPFASSWRPWSIAAGILSSYAALALVLSSYLRHRVGLRAWRLFHYASFAAWGLALSHAFTSGSDSHRSLMLWFYALSAQAVIVLAVFRLVVSIPLRRHERAPAQRA
jgi:predicted ferric reductase